MNMYMSVDFVCIVCVYVCYIAFNPVPGYKRAIKYILFYSILFYSLQPFMSTLSIAVATVSVNMFTLSVAVATVNDNT